MEETGKEDNDAAVRQVWVPWHASQKGDLDGTLHLQSDMVHGHGFDSRTASVNCLERDPTCICMPRGSNVVGVHDSFIHE